jgi:putative redox protein
MKHTVNANWKEGMHFTATAPGGELNLDAAEDVGGKGKGNRSKPLMLAALAGCTGMDVASLIKKMHLEVDDVSINVTAELSEDHPKTYITTHIEYNFTGSNLNEDKLKKSVDLSFDKYCGVIAMFKTFSKVTKEINFN